MKRWFPVMVWGAVILFALSPVLWHAGWPSNHEYLRFGERTLIYVEHWRQGDLVPVWSAADASSLGTPLPLFYHKLFYVVSAFSFLILNNLKGAILLAIAVFMAVGVGGLYAALRQAGCDKYSAVWWAAWLPLLNYTFTDWLVRGAMAELSAIMIFPWCIWWALYSVHQKSLSWWMVPIWAALFLAHNVMALFAGWIFLAVALALMTNHKSVGPILRVAALQLLCLTAVLWPLLGPVKQAWKFYDPSRITDFGFEARENFPVTKRLLADPDYVWQASDKEMMVQLDLPLTLLIVAGIHYWARRWKRPPRELFFVTFMAAWYLFLVISPSRFLYTFLPPLRYIQFPWRLIGFLGPLLLVLAALIAHQAWPRRPGKVAVIGLLILALISPSMDFVGRWYSGDDIRNLKIARVPGSWAGASLIGVGEYLPVVDYGYELADAWAEIPYFANWSVEQDDACSWVAQPTRWQESLIRRYEVNCGSAGVVALPVSYSGWEEMEVVNGAGGVAEKIYPYRIATDPRARVILPAGVSVVTVRLPTLRRAWSAPFLPANRIFEP